LADEERLADMHLDVGELVLGKEGQATRADEGAVVARERRGSNADPEYHWAVRLIEVRDAHDVQTFPVDLQLLQDSEDTGYEFILPNVLDRVVADVPKLLGPVVRFWPGWHLLDNVVGAPYETWARGQSGAETTGFKFSQRADERRTHNGEDV
jgi:hypothetical protein